MLHSIIATSEYARHGEVVRGVIVGGRLVHVAGIVEQHRESPIQVIAPAVQAILTTPAG
jgi:hypothetical protein